jgi:exoribonuclease-2
VPVEGKLVQGPEGVEVGTRLRVQLVSVSVQQGFIDLKNLNRSNH